jgi:hypothetical protein
MLLMFRQGKFGHPSGGPSRSDLQFFRRTRSQRRDVCAGQAGRIGLILRVQSTRYDRCGGYRADENERLIRRHRPMVRPGTIRVLLLCRWRCGEAQLSSSLSELSSAHGAKQLHFPPFPHTRRSCADDGMCQGWRSHQRSDVDDALYSADRKVGHCGMRWRLIRRRRGCWDCGGRL